MADYKQQLEFFLAEAARINERLDELTPAKVEYDTLVSDLEHARSELKSIFNDIESNFQR